MDYTHIRRPVLEVLFKNKAAYMRLVLQVYHTFNSCAL